MKAGRLGVGRDMEEWGGWGGGQEKGLSGIGHRDIEA